MNLNWIMHNPVRRPTAGLDECIIDLSPLALDVRDYATMFAAGVTDADCNDIGRAPIVLSLPCRAEEAAKLDQKTINSLVAEAVERYATIATPSDDLNVEDRISAQIDQWVSQGIDVQSISSMTIAKMDESVRADFLTTESAKIGVEPIGIQPIERVGL